MLETLADLRKAGVDLVTLGQYLRPTPKHAAVDRFVTPETFAMFADEAKKLGFSFVASAPLVRSSYKAAEVFVRSILKPGDPEGADALLKERLAEARAAAEAIDGAPKTTSELAARAAAVLLPANALVRKAT